MGGRYFSSAELGLAPGRKHNEKRVLELYKYFNVTKPPMDEQGKLRRIRDVFSEILSGLDLERVCYNDRLKLKK